MSGLTKKQVLADQYLAAIVGVTEGTLVSYAEIQKGLHEYIKRNNLRGATGRPALKPSVQPVQTVTKVCGNCGGLMSAAASFCDQCGLQLAA